MELQTLEKRGFDRFHVTIDYHPIRLRQIMGFDFVKAHLSFPLRLTLEHYDFSSLSSTKRLLQQGYLKPFSPVVDLYEDYS